MIHNCFRMFLIINLWISDSTQWVSLYGEKTTTYPKSTGFEIPSVLNAASCFQRCLGTFRIHFMFSYNKHQPTCMCCQDLTGVDLVSPRWRSFVPGELHGKKYISLSLDFEELFVKKNIN